MSVQCCDNLLRLGVGALSLGFGGAFGYHAIKYALEMNTLNKITAACCMVLQNRTTEECKELIASTEGLGQYTITHMCDVMDSLKDTDSWAIAVNTIITLGIVGGGIWWCCSDRGAGWRQKINNCCMRREYETVRAETERPQL